MTFAEFFLLFIAVLLSSFGQIFLKTGALKLGSVAPGLFLNHLAKMILVPEIALGLLFYGLGAIAYILVLTRVNLSVAGPAASMIYVVTLWSGYFFFGEPITFWKTIGVAFVVCGVTIIGVKS